MSKIKLILADDELTSRNTIKNYLKDDPDYEIVADFSDGRSALNWLRENDVDILLCDMQMPEMTGVELMRLVHIINEFMPVIAISGFDNFDYVRGSLVNGAANYLLKHELTKERIRTVLDQVREKYRIVPKENSFCRRTGYCIYDSRQYTEKHIRQLVSKGKIAFECINIVPLVLSPDYRLTENIIPAEYKQGIVSAVTDILSQILGQEIQYLVYITQRYHLVILLSFYNMRSNLYMLNTLKNLTGRLQRQIIRMLDLTCTMIIGDVHLELEKAVEESISMEKCLEDKLYLGGNRIVSFAVYSKATYTDEELPRKLWKRLEYELKNEVVGMADTIRSMFEMMEEKHCSREQVIKNVQRMIRMIFDGEKEEEKKLEDKICEYEIFEDFRGEILEIYYHRKMYCSEKRKKYSTVVAHVMEYVEKNYSKEISLESCAQEVGCSYTHLSRIFKQETGIRFVEYLNQCRINKAKSFLIGQDFSMKEIVEKTGFRNYNYFFKVFKESEGMTPSEFAAKN